MKKMEFCGRSRHVLHAFQKKSQEARKQDIEASRRALKQVLERYAT